jgi:hypothetical protein
MMLGTCEHCYKPLRRCKRLDFIGRTIHFSCIEKIKKQRFRENLLELVNILKKKNISLLI